MNRRTFVKRALLTTGALAAGPLLPVSLAQASAKRNVVHSFRPVSFLGPAYRDAMRTHPDWRYVIPIGSGRLHYPRRRVVSERHFNVAMQRTGQIQRCFKWMNGRWPTHLELNTELMKLARVSPQRVSLDWTRAYAGPVVNMTIDNPEVTFGPEAQALVGQLEGIGHTAAAAAAITIGLEAAVELSAIGAEVAAQGLAVMSLGIAADTIAVSAVPTVTLTATGLAAGFAVTAIGFGMLSLGILAILVIVVNIAPQLTNPPVVEPPPVPKPDDNTPPPEEETQGPPRTQDLTVAVLPNENEPEATTEPDMSEAEGNNTDDSSGGTPGDGSDGGDGGDSGC